MYEHQPESKIRYRHIVKRLLKAAVADQRAQAARELLEFRESSILKPLLQALHDPAATVRYEALRALQQRYFNLTRFAPHIVPLLEDDAARVRVVAAEGIFEMFDGDSLQLMLLDVLHDTDEVAVIHAIELLEGVVRVKRQSAEPVIAALLPLLADERTPVAIVATRILGRLQATAALDPMLQQVFDRGEEAQRTVIQALGDIRNEAALAALLQLLDEFPQHIDATAAALAMVGDARAVQPLLQQLRHHPRLSIVDALGRLKDRRALPALRALLQEVRDDPEFASLFEMAIRSIENH